MNTGKTESYGVFGDEHKRKYKIKVQNRVWALYPGKSYALSFKNHSK